MHRLILSLFFVLISSFLFAQDLKKADRAFVDGDYVTAIEQYTLLAEQTEDPQTKATYRFRIGEAYKKLNRPERAEKPFLDAIKGGYMDANVYLYLAEAQLKLGKYDDALSAFESYKRANPFDPAAEIGIASCKLGKENQADNSLFMLTPLTRVNSARNEFGVSYFNDAIIFSSTRSITAEDDDKKKKKDKDQEEDAMGEGNDGEQVFTRTGRGNSNVFIASGSAGGFGRPVLVTELNKMKNFADDGVFAYDPYSRQGYYARRDGKNSYIHFMEYKNNKWEKKGEIKIDGQKEPIGHPFVTPDGNRVYFTSTMPGGQGKSDIWYIERQGSDKWSRPINAGTNINTPGNEVYPHLAGDYLFFASDGHVGYGGFDIFASKYEIGSFGKAHNLGKPFNSYADDYNIALRSDLLEGVLVSGRPILQDGKTKRREDEIYQFKGFPSALGGAGTITDAESGKQISNASIEAFQENNKISKVVSNAEGNYTLYLAPDQEYTIKVTVAGYGASERKIATGSEPFGTLDKTSGVNLDFRLSSNSAVISGRVFDRKTAVPLESMSVSLLIAGKVIKTIKTDANGIYKFGDIKDNTEYTLKVSSDSYFAESLALRTATLSKVKDYNKAAGFNTNFELESVEIGKEILLPKVNFNRETATLTTESHAELDRMVNLFKQNPQYMILIGSYTDTRINNSKTATDLTKNRANTVKNYLTAQGVGTSQISTNGYGRTKLLITRARNEEEHNRNNRITYTITKIVDNYKPTTTVTNNKPSTTSSGNTGTGNNTGGVTKPKPEPSPVVSSSNYEDLPFRVQISALKVLDLNKPIFKKIKTQLGYEIRYHHGPDGWYRYYLGGYATREEANAAAQKLKSIGEEGVVKPKW